MRAWRYDVAIIGGGIVRIGSKITVSEDGRDEHETFLMVGAAEADPTSAKRP